METADVLLLTSKKETVTAVHSALESTEAAGSASLCQSLTDLRARLSKPVPATPHRVAIVDVDENPLQILGDVSRITAAYPNTPFVIVAQEFSEGLVLQAMQAGARHFLRKSAVVAELNSVIKHLLRESRTPTQEGSVISVFSCSGGCGATTVGVNLAVELHLADQRPCLLVDLDPHYGAAAHHLNVTGKYGIAYLFSRQGTIDRHLIESVAARSRDGVDVLLSPAAATADASLSLEWDNLLPVLDACRESYGYVVADAPRLPRRVVADLARVSRMAVIVFQLTVRDLAAARALVPLLLEQGIAPDRILPLANRVGRRGPMLRFAEAQEALGFGTLARVRSDWRKAIYSLNQGQPLAYSARRSGLRRDLRRIAAQIQRQIQDGHPGSGGS